MRRARVSSWIWLTLVGSTLGGCAEPAQAAPPEDTLVLEVGGGQASLRESLRAMGREVAPPRLLRPASQPRSPRGQQLSDDAPVVGVRPAPPAERGDVPPAPIVEPPAPAPAPLDEWVWAELLQDETLSHASYRLLGTSKRFREIMAWNGIPDEAQARRLPTGYRFKVKRTELK